MKKKIILLLIIICMVIVTLVIFNKINVTNKKKENEENSDISNNVEIIENIQKDINSTANTDLFEVVTEYDGKNFIRIKPDIQFNTVLAGIIKKDTPNENEINELIKNAPTNTGIWINDNSREDFINLLESNNINSFEIDENGYLKEKNNKDNELSNKVKIINQMVNSDELYIIDMSGKCYIRDDVSGEILEYPFEEMDPYQLTEPYYNDNVIILNITSNKNNYLSNEEILEGILSFANND